MKNVVMLKRIGEGCIPVGVLPSLLCYRLGKSLTVGIEKKGSYEFQVKEIKICLLAMLKVCVVLCCCVRLPCAENSVVVR